MKKKVRTLEFYGFDDDNTMYDVNPYVISETKEIKNTKYVKYNIDNNELTGNTENNG
jgi:hypothetical protein